MTEEQPTTGTSGPPVQPEQPKSGPGGANYKHASVIMNRYGEGESQYWIFEPAQPRPESAPLIVFNHGWLGISPRNYGAWIDHIVRRGNIVVYPRYQTGILTPAERMTENAINAVKDAIDRLASEDHVKPELDKFAIVGHSLGGGITANMAACYASAGLPKPKAIMLVEPGEGSGFGAGILTNDLNAIPSTVSMLIVVGAEDTLAGDHIAKKIMSETPQIPSTNKAYITVYSDHHGKPPLVADHFAPVAPDDRYGYQDEQPVAEWLREFTRDLTGSTVDALDYYAFWRLCDSLLDAAFYGKGRENVFGDSPEARFMGKWSDGTPVVELGVVNF